MKNFAFVFVMVTLIFGSVFAGPVISINLQPQRCRKGAPMRAFNRSST